MDQNTFKTDFLFSQKVHSLRNASGQDTSRFKKREFCIWYDCIYLLILFHDVHSSVQLRLCYWVSRCAQPRISAHCSYDNKQIPVKELRWIRVREVGGWAAHMWRNIACSLSVCQDRLPQSKRFAVKLRIYAVESGKSLSPSRHVLFFCTSFLIPSHFLLHCFGINVSRWWGISPPLPSLGILGNTRQLHGSQGFITK